MDATTKDYCDPGVTSLMTLAGWCEATGIKAEPGPLGTIEVEPLPELSGRWYDQLWNLSDHAVMGLARRGNSHAVRLTPRDNTRHYGPGYGQA